ncbi:MAG: hypothetical protein EZS28_025493, partial [Streblomastix strix]
MADDIQMEQLNEKEPEIETSDTQNLQQAEEGEMTEKPIENIARQQLTTRQAYANTVLLGLSFFLIFVATDTALHYLSTMFRDNAVYYLAAFGIINGCFALIVPFVIHILGLKTSIHVSSFLCLFFIVMILISQFLEEGAADGKLPVIGFVLVILGAASYGIG